jgi:hypothetical protein
MDSSSSKWLASTERPVPIDEDGGARSMLDRSYWTLEKTCSNQTSTGPNSCSLRSCGPSWLLYCIKPVDRIRTLCIPRRCRGVNVHRLERHRTAMYSYPSHSKGAAQIFYRLWLHLGAESIL